jgi:hypothetical protein
MNRRQTIPDSDVQCNGCSHLADATEMKVCYSCDEPVCEHCRVRCETCRAYLCTTCQKTYGGLSYCQDHLSAALLADFSESIRDRTAEPLGVDFPVVIARFLHDLGPEAASAWLQQVPADGHCRDAVLVPLDSALRGVASECHPAILARNPALQADVLGGMVA